MPPAPDAFFTPRTKQTCDSGLLTTLSVPFPFTADAHYLSHRAGDVPAWQCDLLVYATGYDSMHRFVADLRVETVISVVA